MPYPLNNQELYYRPLHAAVCFCHHTAISILIGRVLTEGRDIENSVFASYGLIDLSI